MKNSKLVRKSLYNEKVSAKIGLEIHVTLSSTKKVFNFSDNLPAEKRPVNFVEPWELGYLGTLPVLNDEVIRFALKTCLFLNARISKQLTFNRKVYSYFDLPKGFQITQQENPIGENGYFTIVVSNEKTIIVPISRIQLEEDTAKTFYQGTEIMLDFGRSGNPLLEIVTEPVFNDIDLVVVFVRQLQSALNYIGVSGAKMERGELRVDLNFSFTFGANYQTPRYEVKNLNSIKNLKMSFQQELERHILIYGNKNVKRFPSQNQTLGFNESLGQTFVQRKKINYFYLPESNIPPILIDDGEISSLQEELPINPLSILHRLNGKSSFHYSIMLFEKPLFAQVFNYLEKEQIDYPSSFNSFASFFFNYIFVSVQNYRDSEIVYFFARKIRYLWKLFVFFEKRLIVKEKISSLITTLFVKCENYSILQWEDLLKKEANDGSDLILDIEKEIVIILHEKKINEKLMSQPSKITNLLLGSLKSKFPSSKLDYGKISQIVNNFVTKSANKSGSI